MDKIKPFLAQLKKHHFWVLSGLLMVTALLVWYIATGELDEKYEKDKATNNTAFAGVSVVKNDYKVNSPPNPEFVKKVDEKRGELEVEVVKAWKDLFDLQMKVLPVNPRVGDMAKYLIDSNFIQKDIPPNLLTTYHNNQIIEQDFKELFDRINLRRIKGANPVDAATEAGAGPAAAFAPAGGSKPAEAAIEGLVVWNATPTPRDLMKRYITQREPKTARVRMTQEDLWVFRTMFDVIAAINNKPIDVWLQILEGETPEDRPVDQANVPIKQIDYCDLAQYAMSSAIESPGVVKVVGKEDEEGSQETQELGGIADSSFSVETKGTDDEEKTMALGRYIDGRNKPVEDPHAPPFTEFKQIFIQMQVLMDQRLIPVLIAQCANADGRLEIETRQVLVDLTQVDVGRSVSAKAAAQQMNKIEQSPHDALVTIRGVVYGYSPPDQKRLGKGSEEEPGNRSYGIPTEMPKALGE